MPQEGKNAGELLPFEAVLMEACAAALSRLMYTLTMMSFVGPNDANLEGNDTEQDAKKRDLALGFFKTTDRALKRACNFFEHRTEHPCLGSSIFLA